MKIKKYFACAMRGRNPDNPSDRRSGIKLVQRIEIKSECIAYTITTVNKDSMVLEINRCMVDRQTDDNKIIRIRQATKKGYIEMLSGNVADLSYPTSKIRRGRVQGNMGTISPTITCGGNAIHKIDMEIINMAKKYRIRKLTPKECFRLQGVTEKDAEAMLSTESNSQCYKAAGNSICVPVLIGLMSQLGLPGIKRWNDMTLEEKKHVIYKGTVLENKVVNNRENLSF